MSERFGSILNSSPDSLGLTVVAVMAVPGLFYEFDEFHAWRDASGEFFWTTDSGCSCPGAFEHVDGIEALEHGDKDRLVDAASSWAKDKKLPSELDDFMRKLK